MKIKLGIAVVYYLERNHEWLLNLHLSEILKNTLDVEYLIYAACGRLDTNYLNTLKKTKHVSIVNIPKTDLRGAQEHCYYLDNLIDQAKIDNCSHILTLDCDSWPIKPNWFSNILSQCNADKVDLAAVIRKELGDSHLPHPCGTFMKSEFFNQYNFEMWGNKSQYDQLKLFNTSTGQRQDSGFGLGFILWENKIRWLKLERTNNKNIHYLMAGIYGGLFFHLGATSRLKIFKPDFDLTWQRKIRKIITAFPIVWKYGEKIENYLLKKFPPAIHHENDQLHKSICEKLIVNSETLYNDLL